MKTTRKLVGLAMLYAIVLSLNSYDYYEPPQLPIEDENNSESSDDSSETEILNQEDKITLYQVEGEDIIKIQDYEVEGELLEFQNDINKHQELWELV